MVGMIMRGENIAVGKCGGRRNLQLFHLWIFGVASVLLDLDHIISLLQKGLAVNWFNITHLADRPLHLPLLFLVGFMCCIAFALVCGLFLGITLSANKELVSVKVGNESPSKSADD